MKDMEEIRVEKGELKVIGKRKKIGVRGIWSDFW